MGGKVFQFKNADGTVVHGEIAEGFLDLPLGDDDTPAHRGGAVRPTPDKEAAGQIAGEEPRQGQKAPANASGRPTALATSSRPLPSYLRDIPLEEYEQPGDLQNWLWTDIIVGDDYIGTVLNCDELGVKAINADRDIVGMFADKDAAETTLFDRWYMARQANGGDSSATVDEEQAPSLPAAPGTSGLSTEITVFSKSGGVLTKKISLSKDGGLERDASECRMAKGLACRIRVAGLHGFAAGLMLLQPHQAIALGALRDGLPDKVNIVTKKKLNGQADTIARTRDEIRYRENYPALVLLDFDHGGIPEGIADRIRCDFWTVLMEVVPDLRHAARLICASTSAGLFNSDTGMRLEGSGGLHGYVMARDGTDAERFLTTLHDRCWLHGLGWIKLGAAGQMLERSIIDRSVAAPERLVFEAPPILEQPLEQDQESRRPIVHDGGILDTVVACPPLTSAEQQKVNGLKAEAKRQIKPQAEKVKAEYIEKNAEALVMRTGMSKEAAIHQIESRCKGILLPETVLEFADKELEGCTVGDVLANPEGFDHCVLADPIEGVAYGRTTAIVLLRRSDGHPWIKSFAHGGMSYTLEPGTDAGVKLKDFYAYMPLHNYIFAPSREPWPGTSVNARIPPIVIGTDKDGSDITMKANVWIDKNQPVEMMTWAPGLPMIIADRLIAEGGWIERQGVSCFNLYRPPMIKSGDASEAKPWVDLVHKVYPNDALHIIKWFAWRRQHPEVKINHGLFLGSQEHGIGKDTILEGVKRAVGPWNFKEVAPKNMFDPFNPWRRAVILRVSEAKDMGDVNRFELYDGMKTLLAGPPDVLECNEKNIKQHYVLNCVGVVITSNHLTDGIYLPAEDRRHYVAWSDCKPGDFDPGYWTRMWEWYNAGGDCHVAAFLATVDLLGFDPKAAPPKTPAFWSIVNANRTTEEGELQDILDQLGNPDAVTIEQIKDKAPITGEKDSLRDWLKDRKNRKAINYRLEKCGYRAVDNPVAKDGHWRINERRQMVYAKATLSLGDQQKAAEILQRKLTEEAKRNAGKAAAEEEKYFGKGSGNKPRT
jgi:Family of unknown function (DUF5906)